MVCIFNLSTSELPEENREFLPWVQQTNLRADTKCTKHKRKKNDLLDFKNASLKKKKASLTVKDTLKRIKIGALDQKKLCVIDYMIKNLYLN